MTDKQTLDEDFIKNPVEAYTKLKAENETYKKMFEDEEFKLALVEVRTGDRFLWFNKAQKLEKALKNIAEGKIGKCCCPEEYAMEVLDNDNV